MENISIKKKESYIQMLRVAASFAVVMIHVIYQGYLEFTDYADENYIFVFNLLCFAVPVFVMITGWIWLNPNKEFHIIKVCKKVIIPLFSFGFVFAIIEEIFLYKVLKISMLYKALYNVIIGRSWAHLWYLYMLIGLYLIMPVIKIISNILSINQVFKIIGVLFLFNSVLIDIEKIFKIDIAFYIPVTGIFVMYLLIGYYLPKVKIPTIILALSWILLFILLVICGILKIRMDSLAYNDVPTIWLSINVYAVFIKCKDKIDKIYCKFRILDIAAKQSFGIYIIHMVFINFMYKFLKINPYIKCPAIFWICASLVIYMFAMIISYIFKKIPIIRLIFPL